MPLWLRLVIAISIFFGVAFGTAFWIGTIRWNTVTDRMVQQLQEPHSGRTPAVALKTIDRLPAPVVRYFHFALKDGAPMVRACRISHEGEFLTNTEGRDWNRFTSREHFSADAPGYVWDATIRMAPFMDVQVRDAYLAGKGSMQARTLAVIPVLNAVDRAELNTGALQRYLAEAVWFPTALLPGAGVVWSAIDDSRASATLRDSGMTVSLQFTFNAKGEVTEIYSPGRYREVTGRYELTPWIITLRNYEERNGMQIPRDAEVAWELQGQRLPYWKGKIVDVRYDFAK